MASSSPPTHSNRLSDNSPERPAHVQRSDHQPPAQSSPAPAEAFRFNEDPAVNTYLTKHSTLIQKFARYECPNWQLKFNIFPSSHETEVFMRDFTSKPLGNLELSRGSSTEEALDKAVQRMRDSVMRYEVIEDLRKAAGGLTIYHRNEEVNAYLHRHEELIRRFADIEFPNWALMFATEGNESRGWRVQLIGLHGEGPNDWMWETKWNEMEAFESAVSRIEMIVEMHEVAARRKAARVGFA